MGGGGSEAHENIALVAIIRFPLPCRVPNMGEETESSDCSTVFATRRTAEIEGCKYAIRNGTAWHLELRDETGLQGLALDSALQHRSRVDIPPVAAAAIVTKRQNSTGSSAFEDPSTLL